MTKNILLTEIKRNDMVSHREIYPLVRGIWNLATVHIQCVWAMLPVSNIPVKGEGGIASPLGAIELIMVRMSEKHPECSDISSEIKSWLAIFNQEYGDPTSTVFMKHINLKIDHAKKLERDTTRWFEIIYKIYEKSNTKLINEKELDEQVVSLSRKLDSKESYDLLDSYYCLTNNIPTPAAMMLYRIAESMVRKYYEFEIGHSPSEGTTMGGMANEIRLKQAKEIEQKKRSKPDSLLNYILSQIDDRNLAQHPERRFNQTEAEEVFIFIKKLINDVYDKVQKK